MKCWRKILFIAPFVIAVILASFIIHRNKEESFAEHKESCTHSPYDAFARGLYPDEVPEGDDVIRISIPNAGFELDQDNDNIPDNWYYPGMIEYANFNCFEGEKCMYINADESGYVVLNSGAIDIIPGKIYSISFNINCIQCENEAAYIGVFWMNSSERGLREFERNILVLNNTKGYRVFNLIAQAPEGAERAIFGIRVHTEAANIMPKTELYIDSVYSFFFLNL